MIDRAVVTDFSRALGAVERSACDRLRRLAAAVPSEQTVVEIGAWKGRTTGYLCLGAQEGQDAQVHTVDPWEDRPRVSWPTNYEDSHVLDSYSAPSTHDQFNDHMSACGATPVVHQDYATNVAESWDQSVGLLWHDGPHDYQAVYADLAAWRDHVAPGGIVALHDAANRSFGVYAAAHDALRGHGFDWDNRQLHLWKKNPEKRGMLVVRRLP